MLVNNAGVGIGAPMAEIQTKHLDIQLGVNLRALIIGTREGLPMLREAGAEHGKALIVNTASIAGKVGQGWLSIYAATKAAVINFTEATHREAGRRGPVHGAGAGLRRHADDRVRQGPGTRRGDDPTRGHRRGGPLPAEDLAQLPCAEIVFTRPGEGLDAALGNGGQGARLRVLLAAFGDPGHVFPAIALGRALADHRHEVSSRPGRSGAGRSRVPDSALLRPRKTECSRRRTPIPLRCPCGRVRALLPLLEEMRPDAVVSDILTLAPALAAEKAGVPLATLIPHLPDR